MVCGKHVVLNIIAVTCIWFVLLCRITTERHRAEVRRAISDDRLAAIADWSVFSVMFYGFGRNI